MTEPSKERAYEVSQNAAIDLVEETRRLLYDKGGDRLGTFVIAAGTYAGALHRQGADQGEDGLRVACGYSGRVLAAMILQVIELEQIIAGLTVQASKPKP